MQQPSTAPRRNTEGPETPRTARATLGATAVLAGGIFASRMLGLLREVLAARQFGTTRVRDCFNLASQVPFGVVTAVGMLLTGAMVPVFTSYVSRGEEDEGWRVVGTIWTVAAIVLTGAWLLATASVGRLAPLLAPGFEASWEEALTARLLRITLPYLVIASLGSVFFCILLSYQRFLPAAVAHAVPNVLIVAVLLGFGSSVRIDALAIGWVLGGVGYAVAQLPAVWRLKGGRSLLALDLQHEGVKQVARLSLPLVIPTALAPVVGMAKRALASKLQVGSIAELDYAEDIVLIPVGILVAATSMVVLPKLAQRVARDDLEGMKRLVSTGLRLVVALTLPAMVLAIMLRHSIVRVLFQRGQFAPQTTGRVADILLWGGGVLVTSGLVEVLTRSFHACQDTLTPSALSVGGSLMKLLLMLALVGPFGVRGLAAASWLTQGLIGTVMAAALRRRVGALRGGEIGRCFVGLAAASAAMALLLWLTTSQVLPGWRGVAGAHEALWLGIQCALGVAAYVLLVLLINPAERRAVLSRVAAARGQ